MTNRSEMLPSYLEGFIEFIKNKDWELVPFEQYYEVLRAVKDDRTISIYQSSRNIFLTVTQESYILWNEYKGIINYIKPSKEEILTLIKERQRNNQ